ncbi:MAG: hypothetical protein ACYTG4_15375 [Planctomycetota bacterium]
MAALITAGASASSSATFDEIAMVAGGARGVEHDEWGMALTQPPLMMYAYGVAALSVSPELPPEEGESWGVERGWDYARTLFFDSGNDPEELLGAARRVGVVLVAILVLVTALYARWIAGTSAGLLAALMIAALPDVLAHGGVAYNDLPLALAFLAGVWAIDTTLRTPSPVRGASLGVLLAAALCVKISALALLPVAALLLAAEAIARPGDGEWRRAVITALGCTALGGVVALVFLYRGDPTLTLFRFTVYNAVARSGAGHPEAAYLLGNTSMTGWWYFFPVVFFLKTPAAFQGLALLGAAGLVTASRRDNASPALNRLVRWRGRGALAGAVVFGAMLASSSLNAGFRYALPVLPLVTVLSAAGLARLWAQGTGRRALIGAIAAAQIVTVAMAYPHMLSFTSVWAGDQDRAWPALLDSSVDWGQGLFALRDFMSEEGVERVRLSYFGSAKPEAYGIDYEPLPSFFRLEGPGTSAPQPRFTVISATTLHGLYLQGYDPMAPYRDREPYRVLGHTLFVYDDAPSPGSDGS